MVWLFDCDSETAHISFIFFFILVYWDSRPRREQVGILLLPWAFSVKCKYFYGLRNISLRHFPVSLWNLSPVICFLTHSFCSYLKGVEVNSHWWSWLSFRPWELLARWWLFSFLREEFILPYIDIWYFISLLVTYIVVLTTILGFLSMRTLAHKEQKVGVKTTPDRLFYSKTQGTMQGRERNGEGRGGGSPMSAKL